MRRKLAWVVLLLVVIGPLAWWAAAERFAAYHRFEGDAFGTTYRVTYRGTAAPETVQRAVEQVLARIDALASTWRDDSELMRYNRAQHPERFRLSAELEGLIARAKAIEAQTGGAFSIRPTGEQIDLSAIAKGYAVDQVVELLQREFTITSCLVDIGGEVRVVGDGPKGDGWHVGLYLPTTAEQIEAPVLHLHDNSVATSGAYLRGEHIIDPATGRAVSNDLLSASVVHPNSATADALATAIFVMGPERGSAWARAHDIRVILLRKDGTRLETEPAQTSQSF